MYLKKKYNIAKTVWNNEGRTNINSLLKFYNKCQWENSLYIDDRNYTPGKSISIRWPELSTHVIVLRVNSPNTAKNHLFETKLGNVPQLLKIVSFSTIKPQNKITNNYKCLYIST